MTTKEKSPLAGGSATTGSETQQDHCTTDEDIKQQISTFVQCVFEPADLVEVRYLPSGKSYWDRADKLTNLANSHTELSKLRQNVYVGVNPRKSKGGTTAADVRLARCLFTDFDGISADEVRERIRIAKLPEPTSIVNSGHGVHAYWRLREPLEDLAKWSALQRWLITLVGSDPVIHDAPRIMRLPGFLNLKDGANPVRAMVLEANPERRVDLSEIERLVPDVVHPLTTGDVDLETMEPASPEAVKMAQAYLAKVPGAIQGGHGDTRTYITACLLIRDFGLTVEQAWPLMAEWNKRCQPPWMISELRKKLVNARKYGRNPPGCKLHGDRMPETVAAEAGKSFPFPATSYDLNHARNESKEKGSNENSFPAITAPKKQDTHLWTPVPISALDAEESVVWSWDGYIAREHITLLAAFWKAGKSTLVSYLLSAMGKGGGLGTTVNPGKILVVSEETRGLWARRRQDLDLGDNVELGIRPFKGRPTQKEWVVFVDRVAELVAERGYALVVFDTFSSFSPIPDENDAAMMTTVLTPLYRVTEAGAAVLLVHHLRKSKGREGQASRGSGVLTSFVDIIVELHRYDAKNMQDTRRTLKSFSRFDETPNELVLELTDDGYRSCGTIGDTYEADKLEVIERILPKNSPGMTPDEVREAWPEGGPVKPGDRTMRKLLNRGTTEGRWLRSGDGTRGKPYRYHIKADKVVHEHEEVLLPPGSENLVDPDFFKVLNEVRDACISDLF